MRYFGYYTMNNLKYFMALSAIILLLLGCSSSPVDDDAAGAPAKMRDLNAELAAIRARQAANDRWYDNARRNQVQGQVTADDNATSDANDANVANDNRTNGSLWQNLWGSNAKNPVPNNDSANPQPTLRGNPRPVGVDGTPLNNIVLFDANSITIRTDAVDILRLHSKYLTSAPQAFVSVEGHGDALGTREYNIALGERRALAVKQFLMAEGVRGDQLRLFSYGKEHPAYPEQNEQAWAKNRRVELQYY